jgi:predicted Zn-dependent protease
MLVGYCAVAAIATAQSSSPEAQKYAALMDQVRELYGKRQYTDALKRLDEAESLRQDNAKVNNVRGSIYTIMRDYAKARASFEASRKLKPDAYETRFNLAELDFVSGQYDAAEAAFRNLLLDYPKLQPGPQQFVQFKIVISQLKQNMTTEAEAAVKTFAFPDNSPAHYGTQAAFALQKKDTATALHLLNKAAGIFKTGEMIPYVDALMEAKWIRIEASTEPKK